MKKAEIQTLLSSARKTAQVNPAAALKTLAALNVRIDFGLGRITAQERDVLLSNSDRALVRLEAQAAAYSKGTLIL